MQVIPSGRALLDPEQILREAGLALDMSYADLGAGTLGHFVFPASQIVGPAGTVYAVDILKSALQSIESRAQLQSVVNIHTIWGDLERPGGVRIPPGSLDLASFVNVAHVLMHSDVPFQEVLRIVRPSGRLLIVDWNPDAGSLLVSQAHRVSAEEVKRRCGENKLIFLDEFAAGPQHWGLLFKHP